MGQVVTDINVYKEFMRVVIHGMASNFLLCMRNNQQPGYLRATGKDGPIEFYVLENISNNPKNPRYELRMIPDVKAEELKVYIYNNFM